MVNTVGSYKNIHWQKKWIPIKEQLVISLKQKDVIIGFLLGDGTMRIGEHAVNANFKVDHGLQQKEYVIWKYRLLKPFVFTEPKISYRRRYNGERYEKSWWFRWCLQYGLWMMVLITKRGLISAHTRSSYMISSYYRKV